MMLDHYVKFMLVLYVQLVTNVILYILVDYEFSRTLIYFEMYEIFEVSNLSLSFLHHIQYNTYKLSLTCIFLSHVI
jgi:hypothetical protein